MPFIRKVRVLFKTTVLHKTRLIFPRINGPNDHVSAIRFLPINLVPKSGASLATRGWRGGIRGERERGREGEGEGGRERERERERERAENHSERGCLSVATSEFAKKSSLRKPCPHYVGYI